MSILVAESIRNHGETLVKSVVLVAHEIKKRQLEKSDLEVQLAKEKMVRPVLSIEVVRYFSASLRTAI